MIEHSPHYWRTRASCNFNDQSYNKYASCYSIEWWAGRLKHYGWFWICEWKSPYSVIEKVHSFGAFKWAQKLYCQIFSLITKYSIHFIKLESDMLRVNPWEFNWVAINQSWIWDWGYLNLETVFWQHLSVHLKRKIDKGVVKRGITLQHHKRLFETFVSWSDISSNALKICFVLTYRRTTISIFIVSIITLFTWSSLPVATFFHTYWFKRHIITTRKSCHYFALGCTSICVI